jgi:glutaminase
MSVNGLRPNISFTTALVAVALASFLTSAQTARSPVAPRRELVEAVVREAYEKFKSDTKGKNADYILTLRRWTPNSLASP